MTSDMKMWSEIRREVLTGVLSQRAASAKEGIGWPVAAYQALLEEVAS